MPIPFDIRQSIYRGTLSQAVEGTGSGMDSVTSGLDSETTMPLRIRASAPASQIVLIENIFVTNPNHARKRTIPPINGVIPSFSSGTITVPTSSGGNLVPSVGSSVILNLATGYNLNVGVNLNSSGQLVLTLGTASLTSPNLNPPPVPQGCRAIGYFNVSNVASVIQAVANSNIVEYAYAPPSAVEGATFVGWGATVSSTPYSVLSSDYIIPINTTSIGSPMVINLPAVSVLQKGRQLIIKDIGGSLSQFNKYAVVTPSTGDGIEGVANQTIRMDMDRMSLTFVCDGATGWFII